MLLAGSLSPMMHMCGGDDLYCPAGVIAPIQVDTGYYTIDYLHGGCPPGTLFFNVNCIFLLLVSFSSAACYVILHNKPIKYICYVIIIGFVLSSAVGMWRDWSKSKDLTLGNKTSVVETFASIPNCQLCPPNTFKITTYVIECSIFLLFVCVCVCVYVYVCMCVCMCCIVINIELPMSSSELFV